MIPDRYGQIGDRPLPFPLWCRECGVMVASSEAHDLFHELLAAVQSHAKGH